jgi:nucleotidyltransferase/DNA polymerase involved in DNA repair
MILHVDMDAFYASVEQLDNPELRGKPVVVGADPDEGRGRGVVSTASYEARKYGIHSAQPISKAYRLCPDGFFLPVRGERYLEVSRDIMSIFFEYTPLVEPISLDEAFLDLKGTKRLKGDPEEIGREIKRKILEQKGLTASVGVAPNKLLAKMASDWDKPDGFVIIHYDQIKKFLDPLSVSKLWGIGRKTEMKLKRLGVHTVGQLSRLSRDLLTDQFGKSGANLWDYSHGIDNSPVLASRDVKSVSNETTFKTDCDDRSIHRDILLQLSEKVAYRLRKKDLKGTTVILKVRLADFTTFVRNERLISPTNRSEDYFPNIIRLYENLDFRNQPLRLLGVGMSQLVEKSGIQTDLFIQNEKLDRLNTAMDRVRKKFGEKSIHRGISSTRR